MGYLSTKEAKGWTRREVPMMIRRSHFCISSIAHWANLSGSASPKKTMSERERERERENGQGRATWSRKGARTKGKE